ncbi:MAG: hypothetical protein AB7F35_18025 [Acetobacteraceae bacterium]
MKTRIFAVILTLAISGGNIPAFAAPPPVPDDGGLHARILPVAAGALMGGFVTMFAAPIVFPGLAGAAGASPFLQPVVLGRALLGLGIGAWVGDRYFP